MLINCSERCVHEDDGLCTLNHIMYSSNEGNDTCPFFKTKNKHNKIANNLNSKEIK